MSSNDHFGPDFTPLELTLCGPKQPLKQIINKTEGKDHATAVKVITSVYRGGLDNLKKNIRIISKV